MRRDRTKPPALPTKRDLVLTLLRRRKGARLDEIAERTSWQPHSVRAVLTALRKQGHVIERQREKDGGSRYQIVVSGSDAR